MLVEEFLKLLSENPSAALEMRLPDGTCVPNHFHVTEVGRVQKDFIDCGGTRRASTACVLQLWVAQDQDHRLSTTKLASILELATSVFAIRDLPIEVEYETSTVSQYPVRSVEITSSSLRIQLGSKHTACLAPELCLVPETGADCCATPGCCS